MDKIKIETKETFNNVFSTITTHTLHTFEDWTKATDDFFLDVIEMLSELYEITYKDVIKLYKEYCSRREVSINN